MPAYTLAQAIAATGRSRSALIRAIRSGKLSAARDASGAYLVDLSELRRVYSGTVSGTPPDSSTGSPGTPNGEATATPISPLRSPPNRRKIRC